VGIGDNEATNKERHDLSLRTVATHLGQFIEQDVIFANDCLDAADTVVQLPTSGPEGVCLMENLLFYKKEEKNDLSIMRLLRAIVRMPALWECPLCWIPSSVPYRGLGRQQI